MGTDEEGVSDATVRALFIGLLDHYPRLHRELAADLSGACCSPEAAVARRAAHIVLGIALTETPWLDAVHHALLEPLQHAPSLHPVAVRALTEAAGVLVRGRPPLATCLLVTVRKQLLFGASSERCLAAQIAAGIIPRLSTEDAEDALEMLVRASPAAPEVDPSFSLAVLHALASVAADGVAGAVPARVKTIAPAVREAVGATAVEPPPPRTQPAAGEEPTTPAERQQPQHHHLHHSVRIRTEVLAVHYASRSATSRRIAVAAAAALTMLTLAEAPQAAPTSFRIELSAEAERTMADGGSRRGEGGGPVRRRVAAELRIAADLLTTLVNLLVRHRGSATDALRRLGVVQALREVYKRIAPPPAATSDDDLDEEDRAPSASAGKRNETEEDQEEVSGVAAAAALGAMKADVGSEALLCHLLHRVRDLDGEEGAQRISSMPQIGQFLTFLLEQEKTHRVAAGEAAYREQHEEAKVSLDRVRRCLDGLASGLTFMVLSRDRAGELAERVIASTSDDLVATLAADMAMRNDRSRKLAARLWLSSLQRVYERSSSSWSSSASASAHGNRLGAAGQLLPAIPRACLPCHRSHALGSSLVAYLPKTTRVASRSKTNACLRYRLVSFFACIGVEDGVDEACAWARECRLPKEKRTTGLTDREARDVVAVLARLSLAALRAPIPSVARAEKRVALLRGLLDLGADLQAATAATQLPKCLEAVPDMSRGERCTAAVEALRDDLSTLATTYRTSADKSVAVPRLTLAVDVLDDCIRDVTTRYQFEHLPEPPPKATEDATTTIGQSLIRQRLKRRRSVSSPHLDRDGKELKSDNKATVATGSETTTDTTTMASVPTRSKDDGSSALANAKDMILVRFKS